MKKRGWFIFFVFLSQMISVSVAGAVNTIMPLGDSITWDDRIEPGGDNRDDGDRIAYRYRLWQLLTDEGYDFDFVGSQYTGYNIFPDAENEGWFGATDDDIAASVYDFLLDNPAKIILLHIGTNDLNPDPTGVKNILDEIDRYEADFGITINVILARIINRVPYSSMTTLYNDNVEDMAFARVNNPTDPAFPDNIIFGIDVDMEDGAGIDYRLVTDNPPGDMWDYLHPAESGYSKMAMVWFSALMEILPRADAGPGQSVEEFGTVSLDGSGSTDPKIGNGNNLSYKWVQTVGTPVLLSDDTAVQPTFDAPDVGANGETLTFKLTVTDEDNLESTDTVSINVIPIAEIIGTWSSGIWYLDVAGSQWTQMTSSITMGDIAAGDFTGDGIADVASIWPSGLYYQDGDTLAWTKVAKSAPVSLTAGDVTGDGRSELIGTWNSGIWYRDLAESSWTQMTSSVTDGDIAAGDFTGDGIADVASIWPNGLWYQDGVTLDWTKVSKKAPNRVTAGDVVDN